MKDLGNLGNGVRIDLSASKNTIGGTDDGAGNTIAFNGANGVLVGSGTGNGILGNSIFSNVKLGSDLGDDGETLNDKTDADSGANNLQNAPELLAVTTNGTASRSSCFASTARRTPCSGSSSFSTGPRMRRVPTTSPRWAKAGNSSLCECTDGRNGKRAIYVSLEQSIARGRVRDRHGDRPGQQHLRVYPRRGSGRTLR